LSVGQALKDGRKLRGLKQSELGVPYGQSMIAKIETGERQIARDMAPIIAKKLDHAALYSELYRELTGIGPAWLDGTNVDLHRSSVREKTLEELHQTIEVIQECSASLPPAAETQLQHKQRHEHLLQALDSVQALWVYVGVQCEDYGYSMQQLYAEHHKKLRSLRYLQS